MRKATFIDYYYITVYIKFWCNALIQTGLARFKREISYTSKVWITESRTSCLLFQSIRSKYSVHRFSNGPFELTRLMLFIQTERVCREMPHLIQYSKCILPTVTQIKNYRFINYFWVRILGVVLCSVKRSRPTFSNNYLNRNNSTYNLMRKCYVRSCLYISYRKLSLPTEFCRSRSSIHST